MLLGRMVNAGTPTEQHSAVAAIAVVTTATTLALSYQADMSLCHASQEQRQC